MRTHMVVLALLAVAGPLRGQDPADSAWAAGAQERARVLYAARVAADSNDAQALHRLGLMRAWNREYAEALRLLDRLQLVAPSYAAQVDRANVLAWSGDYPRAVAAVDQLLANDPAAVDLWISKARYLSWGRRFNESLAAYERLEQLVPDDTAVAHAHARVLSWAGRLNEAADAYRAQLQRDPQDMEALRGLARVASWQGDLSGGERLWRQAISAEPDNAEARLGLSQVLRWQGQARAALSEAETAARVAPTDRDTELQLAWARAAFRPRVAPSVVAEFDSEENRVLTTGLAMNAYLGQRLAVTAQGYMRRADDARVSGGSRESLSGSLGMRAELFGGWTAGVTGGLLSRPDQESVTTTGSVSLASPAWRPITASVSASRSVLDVTALLIENGVRTNEVLLTVGTRLSTSLRVDASGAVAEFRGQETNRRVLGRVGLEARANRWLALRPRFTTFGFDKSTEAGYWEGYWNPERYRIAELGVGIDRYRESWGLSAEVAPGTQQIGAGGHWKGAVSARTRLQYTIAPGRDIGLGFTFSNTGIERHQAQGAGYRYQAAVLSAGWSF